MPTVDSDTAVGTDTKAVWRRATGGGDGAAGYLYTGLGRKYATTACQFTAYCLVCCRSTGGGDGATGDLYA